MGSDNKGKKQKVEETNKSEDQVDAELVLSIEKLQEIQDDLEKINEEASDKVLEIEQKYNEVRKPIYDKRNDVIKSISDFWLTAFMSHPALGELLTEEDQKIFKHLNSMEVEDFKDVKSGYSITFNFNPNPYFEETKLTKTFTFLEEGTTNITATPITWKEGMGITNGEAGKKGNKRSHVDESFFIWFSDTQEKEDDLLHDEVAEIIKEDLWPNPLTYFNNEADDDVEGEEDDDEDKGSDGSDDDEEGDDDEDDEE
ncbi:hypothetical protein Leryth_016745 [Lithospermum erythrorhizon]|uniref:Chromatin/chromatin-binding, or -regulatory protein n=1 Tax=Lithospermum erythrorhizon TaxID=34254 RepID=A0AAV3NZ84_LITER|nr:hypothetical protein Leryth_016745 [Lithospermum erythrorhizon]